MTIDSSVVQPNFLKARPWHDTSLSATDRADALIAEMTLEEKTSQLVGLWVGADDGGGDVAPYQSDMSQDTPVFAEVIADGLGQLTRPFGTVPVDPSAGAQSLARAQRQIMAANRFGIPAQVHEECLAGFSAWGATAYPVPLSWGASFNPELVGRIAAQIGKSLRSVGVHQGLAPVLDVVRDYRWGRVEETIGEDPYLVGTVGAAYVQGLESTGVVATLKHFAGYSGSRAARNHAPVAAGPREMADVYYPPFEMALRHGGARSVMNSYAEVDGVPAAADPQLLTELLRGTWGFDGVVVADYFAIAFLRTLQRVAGTESEAAARALAAGIDVELPSVAAYGKPLNEAVRSGVISEELVNRALRRVLVQKIDLGLLDAGYQPEVPDQVELDTTESQALSLELAREAVVLVANDGVLPLRSEARLAVVGPLADDAYGMLGCYSFPAHVGVKHPERGLGLEIGTVLEGLRGQHQGEIAFAKGCDVKAAGRSGFTAATDAAAGADVAVVVLGDQAGLFGRGTSGEGCDAADLRLPGEQQALLEAVLATGTPVVLLLLSGRPYALGEVAQKCAALVQTFFPGQRGGQAIAEVLTGAVNPSGHLPVSIPNSPHVQPGTYLAPPLGMLNGVSNLDPTALFPFGHGLSYGELSWGNVTTGNQQWQIGESTTLAIELSNNSARRVADVVQVYLHDPVAQVTRPDIRLLAYQRVDLEPGESATVNFSLHSDLTSFAGLKLHQIVEPGELELRISRSSTDVHAVVRRTLVGREQIVGADRELMATSHVHIQSAAPVGEQR